MMMMIILIIIVTLMIIMIIIRSSGMFIKFGTQRTIVSDIQIQDTTNIQKTDQRKTRRSSNQEKH